MKLIYSLLATCTLLAGGRAQLNATTAAALLPSCSLSCLFKFLPDTPCGLTDLQCICNNAQLQANVSVCVQSTCNSADLDTAGNLNAELCAPYEGPNKSLEAKLIIYIPLGIAIVAVALRCYSRYATASHLWWDDGLALASTTVNLIEIVVAALDTSRGYGRHLWYLPLQYVVKLIKLLLVGEFLYILGMNFVRLSILCFYLRVFQHQELFRKIVFGMIIFVAISTVVMCITTSLQCRPLGALWDLSTPMKLSCFNLNTFAYAGAAIGIAQDFAILLLPIPQVLRLQMDLQKKIGVLVMFGTGLCACVVSMVRLKYLIDFGYSTDFTWDSGDGVVWSSIEICVSVICACLPSIRVLISKSLPGDPHPSSAPQSGFSTTYVKKKSGSKSTQYGLSQPSVRDDVDDAVDIKVSPKLEEGKWNNEDMFMASKLGEGRWGSDDSSSRNNNQISEMRSFGSAQLIQPSIYHQQHLWDSAQSEESILNIHQAKSTRLS